MLIGHSYYRLPVAKWPAGAKLRLGLLADLHNNPCPGLEKTIRQSAPDLIVSVGDMASGPLLQGGAPLYGRAYRLLSELVRDYPVFAVAGNHEARWARRPAFAAEYKAYHAALAKKGVRFLDNASLLWEDAATPLRLTGLSLPAEYFTRHLKDVAYEDCPPLSEEVLASLLGPCPQDSPETLQLMLAHDPSHFALYRAWGAELVLSGHMHGGIVRLPMLGGLVGPGMQILPPYTKGLYEEEGARLLVSAGLGTHTIPFRVFDPKEYVVIDLVGPEL